METECDLVSHLCGGMRVVKATGNLFGYERLGCQHDVRYEKFLPDDSGVEASKV